ncbi:MAG: caspase family protein [Planctomycetia bacterium]|nr:caspase family protein [Planctomycetia bacterium]
MKKKFILVFFAIWGLTISLPAEERHLGEFLSRMRSQQGETGSSPRTPPASRTGAFLVEVESNHPNNTCKPGAVVELYVTSEKNGYVTILDANNKQVFPNTYCPKNGIVAGQKQVYPPKDASFQWKFDGKKSQETLTVRVSEMPLQEKDLVTEVKNAIVDVPITFTITEGAAPPEPTPTPAPTPDAKRYFAMFVQTHVTHAGTGEGLLDDNIAFRIGNSTLMRHVFLGIGKCEELALVAGLDLNKRNIRKTFQQMADRTKPGDEIFIYWEGHGGPVEGVGNTTGETDNVNEALLLATVKYDPETKKSSYSLDDILTDDEFAELVRILRERKVTIFMEACFSGGMVMAPSRNFPAFSYRGLRSRNELEEIGRLIRDLSEQTKDLQPVWQEATHICNYNDVPMNRMFGNRRSVARDRFVNHFFARIKDLENDEKNVAMFMSSSETESSWCALVNPNTNKRFALHCGKLEGEDLVLPIGAPTYSLLLTMLDRDGRYTQTAGSPTFNDFVQIANRLIPANNARIVRLHPEEEGHTQTPRSINNIGTIRLIP